MKDKKEITSDIDKIIGLNNEVTDNTHMDLVDEIVDYIESELVELKEQQPEQSAKNMKILSEMANQDELLADMELVQSAEKCYYFIERIRDNAWLTGLFTWTHDPNEAWKTTDKIVLENIVDRMFRNRCVVTEHLFIKQPKDEPKEQSAEERPKIEDYFKKGVTMSEVHKEYTGSPVLFKYAQALDSYIDEWINKWKGE